MEEYTLTVCSRQGVDGPGVTSSASNVAVRCILLAFRRECSTPRCQGELCKSVTMDRASFYALGRRVA